ncbi:M20 family metallopeptidase [Actinomadura barringtoniae]|uniref:M20 family metallopeptidase n=1 Tax=Actinomadura barringtoniae TaxID=1427535 RepID=A0A939T1J9_9ACTN|nr:M20 family metallopeptidase [Actinomadura barringtoniae]MBO2447756.1 M20 family metallopeptidase [Actinomadura barringtoniae]
MNDALALAQRLVRIDTRGGGERPAADVVANVLDDGGFEVRVEEPVEGRANVIARSGPQTPRTPITLTGHLDTVPADPAGWSFDPMSGDVRDGRLLGRGSSDMKAGVAAQIHAALRAVRERAFRERGVPVQLVFTFGEETGCDGAALIDAASVTPTDLLVVAEPTGNRTVLGHKGTLWLQATAHGVSAHGSRPELGRNALAALAAAATRVHEHKDWPASPTHGAATVNVGTFHSGVQPNLVPDRAEMRIDVRTVPGFDSSDAVAAISRLCGTGIDIERLVDLPGVATDPAAPGIPETLELLAPGSSARPPEYATYFTDASLLTTTLGGPAVIIYGPGDPEQAHVTDETCSVAAIEASADAFFRLLCADRASTR